MKDRWAFFYFQVKPLDGQLTVFSSVLGHKLQRSLVVLFSDHFGEVSSRFQIMLFKGVPLVLKTWPARRNVQLKMDNFIFHFLKYKFLLLLLLGIVMKLDSSEVALFFFGNIWCLSMYKNRTARDLFSSLCFVLFLYRSALLLLLFFFSFKKGCRHHVLLRFHGNRTSSPIVLFSLKIRLLIVNNPRLCHV